MGEQKSPTGSHIGGYRRSSTLDVIYVNDMFYRRLSFAITALQNRREIPILLVDHVIMVRLTMWGYHRDHEILDSQTSNIVSYHSISMIMKEKLNILRYLLGIFVNRVGI